MGQSIHQKVRQVNQKLLGKLRETGLLGKYDLVFVIHPGNRGWILDAICKEIANYFPGTCYFHYATSHLPPADAYFFSHYSLLVSSLQANPDLVKRKLLVWFTHPRSESETGLSDRQLYSALNQATKIICTCSQFVDLLHEKGVDPSRTTFVLGAADPDLFQPHSRSTGAIGFSTAYYARKSPDLVLEIIKQLPHRPFILLGKGWEAYDRFTELKALENFSYVQAPYAEYPHYYSQMDVFVSPAKLEGGPIPLIETMMCNVVPVASKTGFAPDIIQHGENGFLFETDSPAEVVCELIEQAFQIKTDVRATVEHLSWKNFSSEIQTFL
ncbi:glycosyltransferase [Phormidium tenue FACHB-886]|nr:glycosyltransferase [Phormidium tenue FACHB-886]